MAGTIFINYRRGASLAEAQHLATLLGQRFGEKRIFIDIRNIDGGEDWRKKLTREIAASEAMVAVIDKNWIDASDTQGNRRLDDPNDFVRFEIAQALQRDIPVLPVVLDGAQVPAVAQLPHDLVALSLFQAMRFRAESVVDDADAIARRMKVMLAKRRRTGVPAWAAGVGAAFLLAAGVAAGPFVLERLRLPALGSSLPNEMQAKAAVADEQITRLTRELKDAEQQRDEFKASLAQAQTERDRARSGLATATSELTSARSTLSTAQRERDQARLEVADLRGQLSAAQEAALGRLESDRSPRAKQPPITSEPLIPAPNLAFLPSERRQMTDYENPGSHPPHTIVIHPDERRLYYVLEEKYGIRYNIALGEPCLDPVRGRNPMRVSRKEEWQEAAATRLTDRQKRELDSLSSSRSGARAIFLAPGTDFIIHATERPLTGGAPVPPTGCIHLSPGDFNALFRRTKVGERVVVEDLLSRPRASPQAVPMPAGSPLR